MTPEPSPSMLSDGLETMYDSPSLSVPEEGLQRQNSNELLQSLLPELCTWADSLSSLPTSEGHSSPASGLSEDSASLPHVAAEHAAGGCSSIDAHLCVASASVSLIKPECSGPLNKAPTMIAMMIIV